MQRNCWCKFQRSRQARVLNVNSPEDNKLEVTLETASQLLQLQRVLLAQRRQREQQQQQQQQQVQVQQQLQLRAQQQLQLQRRTQAPQFRLVPVR